MKRHTLFQTIIGATLVLSAATKSTAQSPDFLFQRQYPYEWNYSGTHSLEICNESGETECYFLAVSDLNFISYFVGGLFKDSLHFPEPAKVFKLSPNGELLGELTLTEEGRATAINKIYKDPFDSKYCYAVGKIHSNDLLFEKPFLVKFDTNLNELWRREIELPKEYQAYFLGARSLLDSQGDIVYCTYPAKVDENGFINEFANLLYIRISREGEVLALGKYPDVSRIFYVAQGGLFEYADSSGDYGQTLVSFANVNPPSYLARIDRNFTHFQSTELPNVYFFDSVAPNQYVQSLNFLETYSEAFTASLPDNTLFMGCMARHNDGYNYSLTDHVITLIKISQDSIFDYTFVPHDNDSMRTLAFCQGMDRYGDGPFFLCNGVYDYNEWIYNQEMVGPNRFVVTKTDADANIIWRRYYEDGVNTYQPCSVMATADEGCLVTGRYWTSDHLVSKVFAIRFLSDGSLSTSEAETLVRPYTFFPNPAQEQLHLQYSPDVQPTQVELYDLQGRLVRSQCQTLESIDIQGLPAGQYLMKVTLENGKTYTDKVMKE